MVNGWPLFLSGSEEDVASISLIFIERCVVYFSQWWLRKCGLSFILSKGGLASLSFILSKESVASSCLIINKGGVAFISLIPSEGDVAFFVPHKKNRALIDLFVYPTIYFSKQGGKNRF